MRLLSLFAAVLVLLAASTFTFSQNANTVSQFSASYENDEVLLTWSILNPSSVGKFVIERGKTELDASVVVCEIPAQNFRKKSETDSLLIYTYICSDKPEQNGVYYYKLTIYDLRNVQLSDPSLLKVGITSLKDVKLDQNNPNPFNPSTVIPYEVINASVVKLSVYTLTGQLIDMLVDGYHTPGKYSVMFNASNYSELSSGIYFYKIESEYTSDIRKMIFTK